MRIRCFCAALALLLSSAAATAAGGRDLRILYAETARAADLRPHAGADKPQGAMSLSFQAYGRQFEVDLEPNSRLLNRLSAAQKKAFARHQLYRGRIRGMPKSWARLTRSSGELQGVIWDGSDLYTLQPARLAAPFTATPLNASGSATVVYRLADVQSALGPEFCGLESSAPVNGAESRKSAQAAYNALIGELQTAAAAVPLKQIEIALIGDFEFRNNQISDPSGAALARMNAVDGIFTEQVGVILQVPEVRIFDTASDPFTKSKASELLDELADYRKDTPAIRNRGLAHLMTGRNLDGDTAGIAFLGTLCATREGASLSEGWRGFTDSMLIAAHEIGHNFGAPHDGVSGACASTPQAYLMAPELNGSNQFSSCSVQQMQPHIQTASCVTTAQISDAAVSAAQIVTGYMGDAIEYPIDVTSLGTVAVQNVTVTISLFAPLTVELAAVPGGTCTTGAGTVTCQLGTLPGEASRQIALRLRPTQTGFFNGSVQLTATNDRTASNNQRDLQILINPRADLALTVSPTSINAYTNQSLSFTATVTASGIDASTNSVVNFHASGLTFESATVANGSCTVSGDNGSCTLGTLTPGSTRQVQVQFRGTQLGSGHISITAYAPNDGRPENSTASVNVFLSAQADAALRFTPDGPLQGTVDQPFDVGVIVLSRGTMAVDNVVVTSNALPDIVIDSATVQDGTCIVTGGTLNCTLGSIAAGASKRIDLRVRGTKTGYLDLPVRVSASNDGDPSTDLQHAFISFAYPVDVGMNVHPFVQPVETRQFHLGVGINSIGRQKARNVTFTAALPASFVVLNAIPTSGNCTISGTTVTCTIAELGPNTSIVVDMDLRSDTTGDFTASLSVAADDDAFAGNNSSAPLFHVRSLVDTAVALPENILTSIVGEPVDFIVDVTTGLRAATNARLYIDLPYWAVAMDEVTAPGGSCALTSDRAICTFAALDAQSSTRVNVRVHGIASAPQAHISVHVDTLDDVDTSNNFSTVYLTLLDPGDVAVSSASTSLSGTANQSFTYAFDITALGTTQSHDVKATVSLPSGLSFVSTGAGSISCSPSSAGVTCTAGVMDGGQTKQARLNLRSSSAGTFSVTTTLSSTNDTNPDNDAQTVSVSIAAAPTPSVNSNDGGGGGGAFGWLSLLGLAAAALKRCWASKTQPNLHAKP